MHISLKPGERIFINGAVLRADRKVTLELMNDVTFLMESHVMQSDEANTPLRQLYFIVQTMLMEPANLDTSRMVFERTHNLLMAAFENEEILEGLRNVGDLIAAGKAFEALKTIRGLYRVEETVLAGKPKIQQHGDKKREVA